MRVRGVGDKESIPANPTRAPPRSGRFVLPRCVGADAGASADGDGWRETENGPSKTTLPTMSQG